MAIITEAEVRAVYATAPKYLKDIINSDEVFNAFHEIRAAYNLHLDHAQNLAMAIDAVILEMRPFKDLDGMLAEGLRTVDVPTRNKIVADIDAKIFVPLRNIAKERAQALQVPTAPVPPKPTPIAQATAALSTEAPAPVAPVKVAQAQVPPVPPTSPVMSVVEQKLSTTSAPPTTAQQVAQPATPPSPAQKYHGVDPYKEPLN